MLTNKDIRVENGNIVINGDKYPLDGQSPEAIMTIVEDNSDTTPTENSNNPVKSGGVYSALSDKRPLSALSSVIGDAVNIATAVSAETAFVTPHEGFVRFVGPSCLCVNTYRMMQSSTNVDYKGIWLPKGVSIYFADGTPPLAQWFNCSND